MEEIIAAIATGLTPAGIGIVRVSGDKAALCCDRILRLRAGKLSELLPRRLYYGTVADGETVLDEVMAVHMPGPHSYTAEDTVEIQCHGGPYLLRKVLEAVLKAGARAARPGEFTERAFLNGRLDLSQAEAVKELIESENEYAGRCALRQLSGETSARIRAFRSEILEKVAAAEASLDDPEHIPMEGFTEDLPEKLADWENQLEEMIRRAENGRLLAEGIVTVILGKPNVGKSSLLNALLGEERAIVTAIPGTTRDTVEEKLRLGELILKIADTAGIREEAGEIERMGIARAFKKAEEAELVLLVLDASCVPDAEDRALLDRFSDRRCLILLNKTDLPSPLPEEEWARFIGRPYLSISAKQGAGLGQIEERISGMFDLGALKAEPAVVTEVRHAECLRKALSSLLRTGEGLAAGMPEDLLTIDLMDACRALGSILGEEAEEDLLSEIFGRFCMGK